MVELVNDRWRCFSGGIIDSNLQCLAYFTTLKVNLQKNCGQHSAEMGMNEQKIRASVLDYLA